ncbi:MAG TPA: pirin family protein [Anaerolineales bacterium]|nr:pirin family protein [Anaerolineales bacterium]
MNFPRKILHLIEPQFVMEGAGVRLRRSFQPSIEHHFDPFLLFDHFAFKDPRQGPIMGFPMHPHRGIETVTYMLEGYTRHRDSLGNVDTIGPGDIQWMTSGRGIMHEEMPRRGESGTIDGFQLWVNLPASKKWAAPRYQGVVADEIPTVELDGARARVVAGTFAGVTGPVTEIAADPLYMDVTVDPGRAVVIPVPEGHTAIAYLFEGEGLFAAAGFSPGNPDEMILVPAVHMLIFADGDHLKIAATPDSHARFMLMAGAPFDEPIFPYGPFVMNTREEIVQAFEELRNGTFIKE